MRATFRPTPGQCIFLVVLTAAALGCSLYMRYWVIQSSTIGVACDTGPRTALCMMRSGVIELSNYTAFGWAALAAAVLNLIRPSVALLATGLAISAFGLVHYSYNVVLSAIAVALMILAFARPAPRTA
jgi:hypothetical protein